MTEANKPTQVLIIETYFYFFNDNDAVFIEPNKDDKLEQIHLLTDPVQTRHVHFWVNIKIDKVTEKLIDKFMERAMHNPDDIDQKLLEANKDNKYKQFAAILLRCHYGAYQQFIANNESIFDSLHNYDLTAFGVPLGRVVDGELDFSILISPVGTDYPKHLSREEYNDKLVGCSFTIRHDTDGAFYAEVVK